MDDALRRLRDLIVRHGENLNLKFLVDNPQHWLQGHDQFSCPITNNPPGTFNRTACLLTCAAIRALWHHLRSNASWDEGSDLVCAQGPPHLQDEWVFQDGLTIEEALIKHPLFEVKLFEDDDYFHCFMVLTTPAENEEQGGDKDFVIIQSYFAHYPVRLTHLSAELRRSLCSLKDGNFDSLPQITDVPVDHLKGPLTIGIYVPPP